MKLELMLVIGTLLTGLVWLIHWLRYRGEEKGGGEARRPGEPWYVEYSRSFFPVLLVVLVLRSFILEPFRIPSGSMIPTLLVGDFILVSKFSYGVRLPVVRTRLIETGLPQRGEVAVFRYPGDPGEDYIKRVVGLPGDRISYLDKVLYINGEPVDRDVVGRYAGGNHLQGLAIVEEVLDGRRYRTLVDTKRPGIEGETRVPPGHYFVLGDNRDHSNDSRFWGFVPEENLVGRAFLIWMHWDARTKRVDFDRIGNRIE